MNKQRIVTFVAVLCFAQLAIIASQQLQDNNSDLQRLRGGAQSLFTSLANFFRHDKDSASAVQGSENAQTATAPSARPRELAPTFLKDGAPKGRISSEAIAHSVPQSTEAAVKKSGSRDPFVPFFTIRNNSKGDSAHPLTNYSLSDLRVVAIIGDSTGNRKASVEAHDGKSFIVRVGTYIGDSGGRVDTITASTIVIVEPRDSSTGISGATVRELSLKTYPTPHSGIAK
jgi:Tfp pilus assembly protein PilP